MQTETPLTKGGVFVYGVTWPSTNTWSQTNNASTHLRVGAGDGTGAHEGRKYNPHYKYIIETISGVGGLRLVVECNPA